VIFFFPKTVKILLPFDQLNLIQFMSEKRKVFSTQFPISTKMIKIPLKIAELSKTSNKVS
jgi:hypothetical protein